MSNGVSFRKTAKAYNIPGATFCRKHKNPDAINKKPGPEPYFSEQVELNIVQWIQLRALRRQPVPKLNSWTQSKIM